MLEVLDPKLVSGEQEQALDEERDLVGEHVVKILNQSPGFRRSQHDEVVGEKREEEVLHPLLSFSNLQWLGQRVRTFRLSQQIVKDLAQRMGAVISFLIKDRQSAWQGLCTLLWFSVFTSLLLSLAYKAIILWCTKVVIIAGSLSLLVLVDFNEIKTMCPQSLVYSAKCCVSLFRWIDGVLLMGRRYAGRDWNTKFHVTSKEAPSRRLSLLKCPPPSEPHDMWSQRTRKHASAISFSYSMLKQNEERLVKKRRSHERAVSMCVEGDAGVATPEGAQSKIKLAQRSRHMSLGDNAGIWETIDQTMVASMSEEGRLNAPTSHLQRPHHERFISDASSTTRRSCSDSDVFSVNDSDDERSSIGKECPTRSKLHNLDDALLSVGSDNGDDMGWVEVGARIGMRILSSEHVQRAVASQDTAERFLDISKKVERKFGTPMHEAREARRRSFQLSSSGVGRDDVNSEASTAFSDSRSLIMPIRPVHSMWTSASAVVPISRESMSSLSDAEVNPEPKLPHVPSVRRLKSIIDSDVLPPRSPTNCNRKSEQKRLQKSLSSCSHVAVSGVRRLSSSILKERWLSAVNSALDSEDEGVVPASCEAEVQDISMEVVLTDENGSKGEQICPTVDKGTSLYSESPLRKVPSKRMLLRTGVKVVVPMFSIQPGICRLAINASGRFFQMATVVSSKRIHVRTNAHSTKSERQHTNCLSLTVNLDKSFLRDGAFAQMTLRIMDAWSDRYMPRHSKFPIGACVATSYGLGILVGWRVEDDCHIVRALWQRSGPGSADAYLNRNALHTIVEAAIGFPVDTTLGKGVVCSYVAAGNEFRNGRYFVQIDESGRHKGQVLEFNRSDILACHGPEFVPIIELIREAAEYQIQVDTYENAMRHQVVGSQQTLDETKWLCFSKGFEIIWSSLLKAVEDDKGFDAGVNQFFSSVIRFLDQLGKPGSQPASIDAPSNGSAVSLEAFVDEADDGTRADGSISIEKSDPFAWVVNDLFGGIFGHKAPPDVEEAVERDAAVSKVLWNQQQYDNAYAVIRALMRTVTIARAECKDMPELKLGLAIAYELLLFVRTVIKIQQTNVSAATLTVWERAIDEIFTTFGPVKVRLEKIARGIAERMKKHGNKAKVRLIRLFDIFVCDETLLLGLERGEWKICLKQVEQALVLAGILTQESRDNYHKTIKFMFNHFAPVAETGSAAARNKEKMVHFAKVVKWLASPRRSLLKLIRHDVSLEILQRIFDRVFRNDPAASLMISIHASNMTTIRHLRMLKDFTICGKLWIPMLEAADQEFLWIVSKMPEKSKTIMVPLCQLFSLGVAQFHKIAGGDLTADWMDFLMEEKAIQLIHQIDVELILQVESFSKDVKEVMVALPFFPSIDEDILNLVDELDIDKFVKEASDAMVDANRLSKFIRDKSTIAIQRFLDYLPKMSIPVDQRDLGDNWVITCRSESGGDLKLSDVCIKRENLICRVMGSETIVLPSFPRKDREHVDEFEIVLKEDRIRASQYDEAEVSIVHQIRELLLNAQRYGCWHSGLGGVGPLASDPYAASVLDGIPVSTVINTGIELWRSLEIDDHELLAIAIKDVSFQIQLNQKREEGMMATEPATPNLDPPALAKSPGPSEASPRRRFYPRADPTLLYLKMKKFTVKLDKFHFRIEKAKKTLFDPVFEGWGKLCVENVSITIRVECRKERSLKLGTELMMPVLVCRQLEVSLENVILEVSNTGADWILNKAVKQFSKDLTKVVESNLQDQVRQQVHTALQNLNSYLQINPDTLLRILGITIDDLEEEVVWV